MKVCSLRKYPRCQFQFDDSEIKFEVKYLINLG